MELNDAYVSQGEKYSNGNEKLMAGDGVTNKSICTFAIFQADFLIKMLKASKPIHEEPSLFSHLKMQPIQDVFNQVQSQICQKLTQANSEL